MPASQQQSVPTDGTTPQHPAQAESARQSARTLEVDNPILRGYRGTAHSGQPIPDFNLSWSPNGFNIPIPIPNIVAQPHQWNVPFDSAMIAPSQNRLGAPSYFNPTGYPTVCDLTDPRQQEHISNIIGNNWSIFSQIGTQVLDGVHDAPDQPPARASISGQLLHQATLQAFQLPANSEELVREPLNRDVPLDAVQGEWSCDFPDWISLVKPRPVGDETVITMRHETQVAIEIILEKLPCQLPAECIGIQIPSTGSVKKSADPTGKTLLECRILLYGATTKQRYENVCPNCEKREGKKKGTPGLIDFHAESDILEQNNGKIRVNFGICCYAKDHQKGDSEYLLEVILSKDKSQKDIMDRYQLPFSFNVVAKKPRQKPPAVRKKRKRVDLEQAEGVPPPPEPRSVRARVHYTNAPAQRNNEPIHLPAEIDPPQVAQPEEGGSCRLPLPPLQQARNLEPSVEHSTFKPPKHVIAPPRTDEEPAPTLTEVNPELGSIAGCATVWLKGNGFSPLFPLFARFGTTVVSTTFSTGNLLACHLPPGSTPGRIDVTLSRHPQPDAPEYGTSVAKFNYSRNHDQLIPILLRIKGQGYPEFTPVLHSILTTPRGPQSNQVLQGGSHDAGPQESSIEAGLIDALNCLEERPNFHEIMSTKNDFNQTFAHLSISYGYSSLLNRLIDWHIDLAIADVNGFTALHYAYMKGDPDAVRLLQRGGAPGFAMDKINRKPAELRPKGWDAPINTDAEFATGLLFYPPTNDIDEQMALGEQFNAFDMSDDNDSGQGQSDSEDGVSDSDENSDDMSVDAHIGGDGGGSGSGSGGRIASSSQETAFSIMNSLLAERPKKRRNRGLRMLPDTPHDPAISKVSIELLKGEAEAGAVEFLLHGVFPSGTISLEALMTEMTPEEANRFQVTPGAQKYHGLLRWGLLRRNRGVVLCRICPEGNQLDFKDPKEALHHITKDHLDMGYSCDCGCKTTFWTSAKWRRHRKSKGLSHVGRTT